MRHFETNHGIGASPLAAKLRCTKGSFLAEHLISIIFIGLLCIAITAGIGAALSTYSGIKTESDAQQLLKQSMQEVGNELTFSLKADADGTYVSPTTRTEVLLENSPEGIMLAHTAQPGGGDGSQPILLVPAAGGLIPSVEVRYSEADNTWSYTVTVTGGDDKVLASEEMKVARTMS